MGFVSRAINVIFNESRNLLGLNVYCDACERPLTDGAVVVGEVVGKYRTGVYNGIFRAEEQVYHAECYAGKNDYFGLKAMLDQYEG